MVAAPSLEEPCERGQRRAMVAMFQRHSPSHVPTWREGIFVVWLYVRPLSARLNGNVRFAVPKSELRV